MANKKSSPTKIKKRYTFRPTLSTLLLLCFGVLFLLAWAFTLGVMAGRNLLPFPFSALSRTEETAAEERKEATADHFEPIKEEDLTFYDQLVPKKERFRKEVTAEPPASVRAVKKKGTPTRGTGEESHQYSVQIAALQDKGKTEEMVERLNGLGYRAYYRQTVIKGETFYRVRCGPFNTVEEARDYAKRLTAREGFKPFVVYPDGN
jgi:cell division septation protein DedD